MLMFNLEAVVFWMEQMQSLRKVLTPNGKQEDQVEPGQSPTTLKGTQGPRKEPRKDCLDCMSRQNGRKI